VRVRAPPCDAASTSLCFEACGGADMRVPVWQGNLGPLVLCLAVTASLKVIDPITMQRGEINEENYFRHPRPAIMTASMAIEYTVLDVELTGKSSGKLQQAELTLARTRDLGANDEQFRTFSHLGAILQAGDVVMAYDMTAAVYNEADTKEWPRLQMPDVIVFKKVYPEHRRRSRMWKLRSLIKQEEEGTYQSLHKTQDKDYEQFLEDVDMDAEIRQRVNVYKNPAYFRLNDDGSVIAPQRMPVVEEDDEQAQADGPATADEGLIGSP
jgi:nonsense-mediated mRNA decay protein 3